MGGDWTRWKAMNGVGLDKVEGNEWSGTGQGGRQ